MADLLNDLPDPVVTLTGFARALRANGVAADPSRLATAVDALRHVDPLDAEQVYWAGRVTLCAEPDDLPRYDAVFDAWFRGRLPMPPGGGRPGATLRVRALAGGPEDESTDPDERDEPDEPLRTAASAAEVLRHRDLALLSDAERAEVNALIALLAPRVARRRTRRTRPGGRDAVDVPRTVRRLL